MLFYLWVVSHNITHYAFVLLYGGEHHAGCLLCAVTSSSEGPTMAACRSPSIFVYLYKCIYKCINV